MKVETLETAMNERPYTHTQEILQGEVRRLRVELGQWQQFAAYCRSCALSGEHDPQDFQDFMAYTGWSAPAALTPRADRRCR